jgi:integrase
LATPAKLDLRTELAGEAVLRKDSALATLYRPVIVTYRLPDGSYRTPAGKRVTKATPRAKRAVSKSPVWHGRFTDANGERHQVKLSESKEIARRMLAKLSGDSQLAGVGLGDRFDGELARPLSEHVEDFRLYLAAKGNSPAYVDMTAKRCLAVLAGVQAELFLDLQPSAVIRFLADLRNQGRAELQLNKRQVKFTRSELVALLGVNPGSLPRMLQRLGMAGEGNGRKRRYPRAVVEALLAQSGRGLSIATSNYYLTAIRGFTRWLVRDGRAPNDPLAGLARMNPDSDVRVERRSLTPAEFTALFKAAVDGREYRGLTGPDRALLYLTAANTGLREGELASLTSGSFDFKALTVTVQAAYSKRRRKDVVPLRPELADRLRAWLGKRKAGAHAWPGRWIQDGAEMIRLDLAAAGIPYIDAEGRVYDFHSLRHQFISNLATAGVHPKVAQELARHSTITLTMDRYTHVALHDQAAALEKLPGLPGVAASASAKQQSPRRQIIGHSEAKIRKIGARRVQGAGA